MWASPCQGVFEIWRQMGHGPSATSTAGRNWHRATGTAGWVPEAAREAIELPVGRLGCTSPPRPRPQPVKAKPCDGLMATTLPCVDVREALQGTTDTAELRVLSKLGEHGEQISLQELIALAAPEQPEQLDRIPQLEL